MSNPDPNASIERELSVLEKIEVAGKFAAVSLPLTYVSGYLILTSYLGTFGIHLNASESFRAKYIFVGFEYLMFIVLMVAIARACLRVAELWLLMNRKLSKSEEDLFQAERDLALSVLEARNKTISSKTWRRFQELRGDFVVGLIVLVFTLEIMFLNPDNIGKLLPLQILYLVAVAIYQATYYREAHEPFAWGLVYGRRYVEDIRWLLVNAQAVAVAALILRVVLNTLLANQDHIIWKSIALCLEWIFAAGALEIEVLSFVSICASKKRLIEIDNHPMFKSVGWESGPNAKRDILSSFGQLRALVGSWEGYFLPCEDKHPRWFIARRRLILFATLLAALWLSWTHVLSDSPFWLSLLLVGAPLFLSLLVLANVGLLTTLFSRRAQRLGYKEESGDNALAQQDISSTIIERTRWMRQHPRFERIGHKVKPGEHEAKWKQSKASENLRQKWERYARRGVMAAVLYVTSVLSFGYVIYPHIPVQKEGGNYATANRVCVRLVEESSFKQCPASLLPNLESQEAFIVLEEDSDWIYLAKDDDMRGPQCWSWAGMEKDYCRPRVYTVSRGCVAGIVAAPPPVQNHASAPSVAIPEGSEVESSPFH